MLKKDQFMANLKSSLKFKVELKRPTSFDDAVAIAREKEWKFQRMAKYGMKKGQPTEDIRKNGDLKTNGEQVGQ